MTGFQLLIVLLFALLLPTLYQVVKLSLMQQRHHRDLLNKINALEHASKHEQAIIEALREELKAVTRLIKQPH